jgi:hypothetical protein
MCGKPSLNNANRIPVPELLTGKAIEKLITFFLRPTVGLLYGTPPKYIIRYPAENDTKISA